MPKNEDFIEKLFSRHLQSDEEIIWLGEQNSNLFTRLIKRNYLNLADLLTDLLNSTLLILRHFFTLLLYLSYFMVIGLIIAVGATFIYGMNNSMSWSENGIFFFSFYIIGLTIAVILIYYHNVLKKSPNFKALGSKLSETPKAWWRDYFTITNQRILAFSQGELRQFSLLLLQDAILSKPRNGAVDILLYDKHNPTGELPQPIGILEGIAEEEAQAAYELLRQAREEALNTRAQELGID